MLIMFMLVDLEIQLCNIKFNDEVVLNECWWVGGDLIVIVWYNVFFIIFLVGEIFFIESVWCFEKDVFDYLGEQIKVFVKQEVFYIWEYNLFNLCVKEVGYDIV